MKTIETFLIEEVSDFIHDADALKEWNDLVERLNLEGQSKLLKDGKSPIPFLYLNNSATNVFTTLCPRIVEIEKFDVTPIPTQILSLVALSLKEGYFNRIEIWYDEKSPDPVCVGMTGYYYQPTWYSQSQKEFNDLKFNSYKEAVDAGVKESCICFCTDKRYLIGKWGEEKKPYQKLKEIAMERFIANKKNEYEIELEKYKRKLHDLNQEAYNFFN